MLERLGFQSLPQRQRAPGNARIDETDGILSEHGWNAWSQALVITNLVPFRGQLSRNYKRLTEKYGTSPAWIRPVKGKQPQLPTGPPGNLRTTETPLPIAGLRGFGSPLAPPWNAGGYQRSQRS